MAAHSKDTRSKLNIDPLMTQIFSSGLRKGDRKKAEILSRALEILADKGLEALSYDRLAKALKISKSHVAYHFESIDSLLMKATEFMAAHAQSYVVKELMDAKPGKERLMAYVRGNFKWLREEQKHAKVFEIFLYLSSQRTNFADYNLKVRTASKDRIDSILSECEFSKGPKRERMAQFIVDYVTGAIVDIIILPTRGDWKESCDYKLKLCYEVFEMLLKS